MALVQLAFSSGRDRDLRWRIEEAIVPRCKLHDLRADLDANRSWLSFSGSEEASTEVLGEVLELVMDRVDLTRHAGSHPRIGAVDDLRLIGEFDVQALAEQLSNRFEVPIFLTGQSRVQLTEADLDAARKRGFGGLMAEMPTPDLGPAAVHPHLGVLPMGKWRFYLSAQARIAESTLNVSARLAQEVASYVELEHERFQGVTAMAYQRQEFGDTILHLEFREPDLAPPDPIFKWVHLRAEAMRRAVLKVEMVGAVRPSDLISTRLAPVRSKQVVWA